MASGKGWLKRGLSPENLVQAIVSLLAGVGVPAVIKWLAHTHVSTWSLVMAGVGSAFLAFGLLLIVRGRANFGQPGLSAETLRSAISGLTFETTSGMTGPSIPVGARTVESGWYVEHDGFGSPPFTLVRLRIGIAREANPGSKRLACEVTDPDWRVLVHRFWDPNVASHHLPDLTSTYCIYPTWFVEDPPEGEHVPLSQDGFYDVRWWSVDEDGTRAEIAADRFEVRDGGLIL